MFGFGFNLAYLQNLQLLAQTALAWQNTNTSWENINTNWEDIR